MSKFLLRAWIPLLIVLGIVVIAPPSAQAQDPVRDVISTADDFLSQAAAAYEADKATDGNLYLTTALALLNSIDEAPDCPTLPQAIILLEQAQSIDAITTRQTMVEGARALLITCVNDGANTVSDPDTDPGGDEPVLGVLPDNTITRENVTQLEQRFQLGENEGSVVRLAFNPDSTMMAAGVWNGNVRLWDTETGETRAVLVGHDGAVYSVAFNADGTQLLSGSIDATMRLWDVESGQTLVEFVGHSRDVVSVALSPDGRYALSGSWDDTARLWDIESGKTLVTYTGHDNHIATVAFSPDGSMVATGAWDDTIILWETETGAIIRTLTGHRNYVNTLQFTEDGEFLLSGSGDSEMRLWDTLTGVTQITFIGHTETIYDAMFSPDGNLVVSASWDDTMRIWDARSGELLWTTDSTRNYNTARFSSDGTMVAGGGDTGTIELFALPDTP